MSSLKKNINLINKLSWRLMDKPETAGIWNEETKEPISKTLLNTKITNAKKPGKIAIIWNDGKPIYFTEFKGNTLKDFMDSIYNETQKTIGPKNSEPTEVYKMIGNFYKPSSRIEMVNAYENGKLKVERLIGDYYFFDGGIRKEKHNGESIWVFGIGS